MSLRTYLVSVSMAFALFCTFFANAQTVSVGTQTTTNTTYGPINRTSNTTTNDYSRFSYLYLASEMGLPPGSIIQSIEFFKGNNSTITGGGNATLDLYLRNTATASFPATELWGTLIAGSTLVETRVISNFDVYPNEPGNLQTAIDWMNFPITPFQYTGQNLQVSAAWDCSALTGTPSSGAITWGQQGSLTGRTLGNIGTTPPGTLQQTTYGAGRPVLRINYTPPPPAPDDAAISAIASPTSPHAPGVQNLSVTLNNPGTNALNSVDIYYSINGAVTGPLAWPGPLPLSGGTSAGPLTIATPNFALGTNLLKVWTQAPNGGADSNPYNDTLTVSLNTCNVLNGIYTINSGGGGDYTSIGAAVAAMASCGITGPVTFNVAPGSGPYTERVVIPAISGASTVNTITFNGNGNTIVHTTSVTADRAAIQFNGADHVTISNFIIDVDNGPVANYGWGVHLTNQADNNTITGCTIHCFQNSTSTNFAGIVASGSSTSATTVGNSCSNTLIQNNTINYGYYGIHLHAATGTHGTFNTVRDNLIRDFYADGIGFVYQSNSVIEGNECTRPNATTTGAPTGIILETGGQGNTIDGNRVHHLGTTTTNYGYYVTSLDAGVGNPNIFRNNLFYGVNNSNGSVYALYNSGSDNVHYHHNSILIDDQAATTGVAYGFYQTTAATGLEIRNNVIKISRSGTGTKRCISFTSSGATAVSNNNDLYNSSTGGTANEVAYYTPTGYATLALWQASNGNVYDQNSVSVDPAFVDAANGNLQPTAGGLNDVGDINVPAAFDILGVPRPLGVNPDPGAYEFAPPALDAAITWVSPVAPVALGPATITVNISNAPSSSGPITEVDLTYSDGITPVNEVFPALNIAPGADADLSFTVPFNIASSHALRAWINSVNTAADGNQNNDTTATVPLCAALAGVYDIDLGGSGDFLTIADFATAVSTCGVSAPVVANVLAGSGPYAQHVVFGEIGGSSATNTVTLNGNGASVLYSTATTADRSAILLDGTDYLTINGLTINTSGGAFGHGVHLMGQADHNTISNNTIICPTNNTSTQQAGIVSSSSTGNATGAGDNANHTLIEGNTIRFGYYAVRLNGLATVFDSSNVVRDNLLEDFYSYGVYLLNQQDPLIEKNEMTRPNHTNPTTFYGVYSTTGLRGAIIDGNRIHNSNGAGGTAAAYGVNFATVPTTVGSPHIIRNNLIYDLNTPSGTINGFINTATSNAHYFHNTVVINDPTNTAGFTRGFYQTTAATGIELRNNIFYIARGGTGDKECMYFNTPATTFVSDHNVLVMLSTGGTINATAYYNGVDHVTLANWQASNGNAYDQSSVAVDPMFAGPTDLTPTSGGVNDICTGPVLVPVDYNGVARPLGVYPDPGAIEFDPPSGDAIITWVAPVNPVAPGSLTVTVNIANSVSSLSAITSLNLTYSDGATPVTEGFGPLSIAPGANTNISFTVPFNLLTSANLRAWVNTVNGAPDDLQSNDTTATVYVCGGLVGNYVIDNGGSGDYLTVQAFVDDMVACGIAGPVVGDVLAGSGPYVNRAVIPAILGASSTNTITINGNGAVVNYAPTVTGERAAFLLNGADHVTIDGFVINVSAGTYGFGVHLTNQADFNTIRNNTITCLANSTSTNFSGITASGGLTSASTTGNSGSNNLIEGNTINYGYYGIHLHAATGTHGQNNQVRDNEVRDFYLDGVSFTYQSNGVIADNNIHRPNATTTGTTTAVGLETGGSGNMIEGNRVHHLKSTTTNYAFYVSSADGTAIAPNVFRNNIAYGFNNANGTAYGFYNSGSDHAWYHHNTVTIDDQVPTTGTAYGFYQTTLATGLQYRNNIASITRSGTGAKRCLSMITATTTFTSNNNVFHMGATAGTTNFVAYLGSTGYATMAAWQASNGSVYDQNSTDADPVFYGPNNPTPSSSAVNDIADAAVGVLTDINGVTRPLGAAPDPGAIEFNLPDCQFPTSLISPSNSLTNIDVVWNSGAGNTGYTLEYGPVGFTQGTGTIITGSAPLGGAITISPLAPSTSYDFYLTETCSNGTSPTIGPETFATDQTITVFPACESFESWSTCAVTTTCKPDGSCTLGGDWLNVTGEDGADWTVDIGGTATTTTGPGTDHTLGTASGRYIYTESSTCYAVTHIAESPVYDISGMTNDAVLSFWYHMFGPSMGTLEFQAESPYGSDNWVTIWTRSGPAQTARTQPWINVSVPIPPSIGDLVQLRIVGITGGSFNSDMAVDDVCISEGVCNYPSFTASITCLPNNDAVISIDALNMGSATLVDIDTTTVFGTATALPGMDGAGLPYVVGAFPSLSDVTVTVRNAAIPSCFSTKTYLNIDCFNQSNDTCFNEDPSDVMIGIGSNVILQGSTTGADDDLGLIASGVFGAGNLGYVWESFTTTQCLDLVVRFCGTSPSYGLVTLHMYTDCSGTNPVNSQSYDFTGCGDGNASVYYNSLPPGTYYYPVLYNPGTGNTGPYTMNIVGFSPVVPCTPNVCAEALPIVCGGQVTGTTISNTATQGPSACLPNHVAPGRDAWYSYTATGTDMIIASTCIGSNYNTMITVYQGAPDCSNLVCVTGNDDNCGLGAGTPSEVNWISSPGTTYYIAVHGPNGYANSTGIFQLSVTCGAGCVPQLNDACGGAVPLSSVLADGSGVPTVGDNSCSFADPNPTCDVSGINAGRTQGVWYSFNSGANTFMSLSLYNSYFGYGSPLTSYALYTGTCGNLTEVACGIDLEGSTGMVPVDPATQYYLMVFNDGGIGLEGTFGILLEHPAQNDAALDTVLYPNGLICTSQIAPEVVFTNKGLQTLTSLTFQYDIDGMGQQSYVWTGSLPFMGTDTIQLPVIGTTQGGHTLNIVAVMPNGVADEITADNTVSSTFDSAGESVVIEITQDRFGSDMTWEVYDALEIAPIASGGPYTDLPANGVTVHSGTYCLPTIFGNCFSLRLYDSFGDGLCCSYGAGGWRVLTGQGDVLIQDAFHGSGTLTGSSVVDGSQSPALGLNPTYTGHEFCLPKGPTSIEAGECNVFTNTLGSKVYTTAAPGSGPYQFEFLDPDAAYRRRISVTNRYVKLSQLQTVPLVAGTHYFVRSRRDAMNDGFLNDNWGSGCNMGLDPAAVPGCSQLINDTDIPTHSCGVTRSFGYSDKIWAVPVLGATQYRFRFVGALDQDGPTGPLAPLPGTRVITVNTYVRVLNWASYTLVDGETYNVDVEVFVNGQWSGYCGSVCTVTIDNPAFAGGGLNAVAAEGARAFELYPNPVKDGRVIVKVEGLNTDIPQVTIDVRDVFGKLVHSKTIPTGGGDAINTVLELDRGIASGLYTVELTTGEGRYVRQLVIQ